MPIPGLLGMPRGGVSPAGPVVTITPESVTDNHYGAPAYSERAFTVVSLLGTPTSWLWSIAAGTGSIISGQGTATAQIRTSSTCVIRCAVVIAGITYNPEASLFYEPGAVPSGGGTGLPPRGGGGELA